MLAGSWAGRWRGAGCKTSERGACPSHKCRFLEKEFRAWRGHGEPGPRALSLATEWNCDCIRWGERSRGNAGLGSPAWGVRSRWEGQGVGRVRVGPSTRQVAGTEQTGTQEGKHPGEVGEGSSKTGGVSTPGGARRATGGMGKAVGGIGEGHGGTRKELGRSGGRRGGTPAVTGWAEWGHQNPGPSSCSPGPIWPRWSPLSSTVLSTPQGERCVRWRRSFVSSLPPSSLAWAAWQVGAEQGGGPGTGAGGGVL